MRVSQDELSPFLFLLGQGNDVGLADLRDRIASGEFPPGAKLPSGRELVSQYGVALLTAQSALQRLRDQRLAYSSARGYFVGEPEAQPNLADQLAEVQAEVQELRARVETLEAGQ